MMGFFPTGFHLSHPEQTLPIFMGKSFFPPAFVYFYIEFRTHTQSYKYLNIKLLAIQQLWAEDCKRLQTNNNNK